MPYKIFARSVKNVQKKTAVGVSVPTNLLTQIDNCRGESTSRSDFIVRLIERGIAANADTSREG